MMIAIKKIPETESELHSLADALIEYAAKETSLDLNSFPLGLNINPIAFKKLGEKSEYFSDSYEIALALISSRLRKLAFAGKIESRVALEMLALSDHEYKSWLLEKQKREDDKNQKTIVVLERAPTTDIVPPKGNQ